MPAQSWRPLIHNTTSISILGEAREDPLLSQPPQYNYKRKQKEESGSRNSDLCGHEVGTNSNNDDDHSSARTGSYTQK